MNFRHSIVTRFALFFTGLIVFSILLSGFLIFKNASTVITNYSKERLLHTSELAEKSFQAQLTEVSNDILLIANSPTLKNFIDIDSKDTRQYLEDFFKITLENKHSYFQLRLLDIENNGQEIIRLDKKGQKVFKSEDLQEKGNRDYFKEASTLPKNEVYFSKINLNEEYGVISIPETPTLRVATPVFDKNYVKIGILIINVDLKSLYQSLGNILSDGLQLYLIDENGQYLYAQDQDIRFGSQLKTNQNFYTNYKTDLENISSNTTHFIKLNDNVSSNNYLSFTKKLTYFNDTRNMFLVSMIEQNKLLQSAQQVGVNSFKTMLVICLFCILVSYFFTNYFSKQIKQITKAISIYEDNNSKDLKLPTHRKDEIGTLAKTFTKMKSRIDKNVDELNIAFQKEQHAKQQRDKFLQNMSHEMRTPLNAITGLTQLLSKNSPLPNQIPIINSLERSAQSLSGLVYDVLDHQNLVEGKVKILNKPTNIALLLKGIHATYQFEAIQKGLKFNLDIDENLKNSEYLMDELRLSQIVINLIVNAIKFTDNGTVQVKASVIKAQGIIENLEIKVIDSGIGILPENLDKINERFFQEKVDITGRYGGYGLGLSIVKQLTLLFNGSLNAQSTKGKGSTFTVLIPLIKDVSTKEIKIKDSNKYILPKLNNTYTVLHIEDDLPTVDLIKHLLNFDCIHLIQISKFKELQNKIETLTPDLLISDLLLDNNNLSSSLSNWITTKKITCPLVLISGMEKEIMNEISPIYLQKPFDINVLRDLVFKILGANEYQAPDFKNIYKNYDNDSKKITKVLSLIENEFTIYNDRIKKTSVSKNQQEWEDIIHKLINHIHNLNLNSLKKVLPNEIKNISEAQIKSIQTIFNYYGCCIRTEKNLLNSSMDS
ncbi:ATP-binding response regulator [Urechidicola croceus]|uniref:histidine kinase n=1 Tax=Urechidicola croceus TaxID=1850246 RepID=A0A1D8P5D6_9FLAO|nr:sensor histidine kinase [Urechidicola croceus]AOW19790.1 hypothetical protein LPB138_03420 [Urechidicola croceus]